MMAAIDIKPSVVLNWSIYMCRDHKSVEMVPQHSLPRLVDSPIVSESTVACKGIGVQTRGRTT